MGHSHRDGAHTHGSSGAGLGALDQLAEVIAVLGLAVVAVDVAMWLLHILVILATAVGFLAIGTGAGYAAVKWRQFQRRRLIRPPQYYPPQFYPPPMPGQFTSQPATPALPPAGEVHLHLHGADAQAVLRAIGHRGGDAR
jgi:hypothetical protein